MLYKIADLLVDIPSVGEMYLRSHDYIVEDTLQSDIVIREELYHPDQYSNLTQNDNIYLQSGWQFYRQLLKHNGMMLHASAVALDGRAYLFSGPCGMGKSTHTRLWQQVFGEKAVVFNDDKPALRRLEDENGNHCWYAYGTPWCGKDGINVNMKVPLAGICFLKQASENRIRRLNSMEALQKILPQTLRKLKPENMDLLIGHLDKLIREIPIFELENLPIPDAARLSYETMRRAAEEVGL